MLARWQKASIRALTRQRLQLALAILGIGLGVAVVVAVQLANASAERAFELSVERLTGDASHQITGPPEGVDEALYRELRLDQGLRTGAPIIEGFAERDGETLRVLGVDPLAGSAAGPDVGAIDGAALRRLIGASDTLLLAAPTAKRWGVAAGDEIRLSLGGRERSVTVVGLIEPGNQPAAAIAGLAIIDIADAQIWFERRGQLDRIELQLDADDAEALRDSLPAALRLERVDQRQQRAAAMTAAFRTNLTAMALLAVVIGIFLIYNTMTFAVVRRRRLIATLRGLGVTRAMIFGQIVAETLVLGAIATALGLVGGIALAHGLIGLITRTINDLYFVLTVSEVFVSPAILAQGIAIGLGAALVGALGPALEAAGSPPAAAGQRSVLEQRSRNLSRPLALVGVVLLVIFAALLVLPSRSLVIGFLALTALLLGAALLMPVGLLAITPGLARITGALFGVLGRMAARGTAAGLSRTGLAVVALALALTATVSVGMMITSFRGSVEQWLERTLSADIYLSAPGRVAQDRANALSPKVADRVANIDAVAAFSRGWRVTVDSPNGPTEILALDPAPASLDALEIMTGDAARAREAVRAGEALLVTEPYANHNDIGPGDRIALHTGEGLQSFRVAGVYRDYNSDRGRVFMARSLYERWWGEAQTSSLGLYLTADADPERVTERLRNDLAGAGPVAINPSAAIREQSLVVFDRTFAITGILRWLALGVAFVGVVTALLALELERARERAILRATGATPLQIGGVVLLQNGLLGALAGLFSLPLGYALGQVLIHVINRRGFGWSIDTIVPAGVFAEALALAVGAALLAGLWPAWRAARSAPATYLREE